MMNAYLEWTAVYLHIPTMYATVLHRCVGKKAPIPINKYLLKFGHLPPTILTFYYKSKRTFVPCIYRMPGKLNKVSWGCVIYLLV